MLPRLVLPVRQHRQRTDDQGAALLLGLPVGGDDRQHRQRLAEAHVVTKEPTTRKGRCFSRWHKSLRDHVRVPGLTALLRAAPEHDAVFGGNRHVPHGRAPLPLDRPMQRLALVLQQRRGHGTGLWGFRHVLVLHPPRVQLLEALGDVELAVFRLRGDQHRGLGGGHAAGDFLPLGGVQLLHKHTLGHVDHRGAGLGRLDLLDDRRELRHRLPERACAAEGDVHRHLELLLGTSWHQHLGPQTGALVKDGAERPCHVFADPTDLLLEGIDDAKPRSALPHELALLSVADLPSMVLHTDDMCVQLQEEVLVLVLHASERRAPDA
mmetsp:Transcript_101480/g.293596  ORF Transcript_101480/g.293596 Transcript_101480/m.293596 type:complete len:323 (+) Transcript_101480:1778-2746(+)